MEFTMKYNIAILGASGMIGMNVISFMSQHPNIDSITAFSRSQKGNTISQNWPMLKKLSNVRFEEFSIEKLKNCDCLFLCLPHGKSFQYMEEIILSGVRVIDLSRDFRFSSKEVYRSSLNEDHPFPDLLKEFVTIIPEINGKEAVDKKYVSLYGCNSSLNIIALYPLIDSGLISKQNLFIDSKLPSSGGVREKVGRSQLHFSRKDNVRPYKLLKEHRHTDEITDFYQDYIQNNEINVFLNTYSVDLTRGISSSIYFQANTPIKENDLRKLYRKYYEDESFIRIIKQFSGNELYPTTKGVANTNFLDIGFSFNEAHNAGVIIATSDNLIKGGAGQGIQVFNIQNNLPIDTGLYRWPDFN